MRQEAGRSRPSLLEGISSGLDDPHRYGNPGVV